jgi:hypothetical protein
MKDGYVKNDETSSIFIRAAHLIGAFLGSVIHVAHCPEIFLGGRSSRQPHKEKHDLVPGHANSQQIQPPHHSSGAD